MIEDPKMWKCKNVKNIEKGKKTGLKDFINMKLKKFKKYKNLNMYKT